MIQKETALRMLNEHGEPLIITRFISGGSINKVTGDQESGQTETLYPHGLPITDKSTIGKYFGTVASNERIFMIDAGSELTAGMTARCSDGSFRIDELKAERYKGEPIYYMARLVK